MTKFLSFLIFSNLLGCEASPEFYIDQECTDREVVLIFEALDEVDAKFGEKTFVMGGFHDVPTDCANDGDTSIICSDFDNSVQAGSYSSGKDIRIFRRNIFSDENFVNVLLHEIGHLLAGNGEHILGNIDEKIMTPVTSELTKYSEEDVRFINSFRGQKKAR